jgi:hypothetical protein
MKFIRTLFQTTVLLAMMVVFSQPVLAQMDNSFGLPAPATDTPPAHLSVLSLLAELGSGFIDGVLTLLVVLLAGLTFWLAIPARRIEKVADEQPPVEVPPLRPVPHRVTRF